MVTLIIDSIIDNYERRLTSMRESLSRTVTELEAMTKKYRISTDELVEAWKGIAQLQRELDSAKLEQLRTMDHLIAAVMCITDPSICDTDSTGKLRDALYAIPRSMVAPADQIHIAAVENALDCMEGAPK